MSRPPDREDLADLVRKALVQAKAGGQVPTALVAHDPVTGEAHVWPLLRVPPAALAADLEAVGRKEASRAK